MGKLFDIVTTEDIDGLVSATWKTITEGQSSNVAIATNGCECRLITHEGVKLIDGSGEPNVSTLVILAHASSKTLSGMNSWEKYKDEFNSVGIQWGDYDRVYLVACKSNREDLDGSGIFLHGTIAKQVAEDLKKKNNNVVVWAADEAVGADLKANWQQIK